MCKQPLYFTVLFFFFSLLVACASWNSPSTTKKSICNQLKSDLVFSGSTSDTRQADIQMAEQPMYQRNFDRNNCS